MSQPIIWRLVIPAADGGDEAVIGRGEDAGLRLCQVTVTVGSG
jgi:hypothetical protein